jgi:mannobiose 2-epimerase
MKLADEAEAMLRRDVLEVWFPRTVDQQNGGFSSGFTRDWKLGANEGKFSVFQGRMTWVAAQVAMRRPDMKAKFLPIAEHGVEYLNNVLWDKQHGGFFWGLDDRGQISPRYTDGKHLYGISFAIYGAAAAYQAGKNREALELAKKAFRWVEEHAHDDKDGGYFEWLTRDGKVVQGDPNQVRLQGSPVAEFPIGYKSMNTHIHLLEAYSQLYEVWKDDSLRRRVQELITIIRDKICVQPGVMNLYFTNQWQAIPGHDSYGHDIETAYLLLEAEEILGAGHDPRTERMVRMLVDHGIAYGWDEMHGGVYREGTAFGPAEDKNKEWWVEFETLNALLLMHEKYGQQDGSYFKLFQQQWECIKRYQIDAEFHGVYEMVDFEGKVLVPEKGRIWKCAYHESRALMNVSERLRRLAKSSPQ